MTRLAFILTLLITALPARAQRACEGYIGVAPLFHRYVAMLEPKSDDHARAIATRVKLDVLKDDGPTWLSRRGLRPDHAGFGDLAASVESARALAELWLGGGPVTAGALRRHAAARETMGLRLVESGCFSEGSIVQVGQNDAPLSDTKRAPKTGDLTLAETATAIARQWQNFRQDPPPVWVIALYLAVPLAAIGGLWIYLDQRRRHERRGYPRRIFTGQLTLAHGQDQVAVAAADIGRGGAKIHLDHRLDGARRVEVHAAGLVIPALLSWQSSHFQGLSFLQPITRSQLRAICAAAARK